MAPKLTVKLPKIKSFSGNSEELKMAKYLLAFLLTGSESETQRASSLGEKTHKRIIRWRSTRILKVW
jgi:hypothetical protein